MPTIGERLDLGLARGLGPIGFPAARLRAALVLWEASCARRGADPAILTAAAGCAFLADIRAEAACARTAFAQFAQFQVAAALVWGAAEAGPLAAILRAERVSTKPPPADRWTRAARAIDRLTPEARALFEPVLARSRAPRPGPGLVWSAARIVSVSYALARWLAFTAGTDARPTARGFRLWAEEIAAGGAGPRSVAAYLEHVLAAHEQILTPGALYDGAGAVAEAWHAKGRAAPRRRGGAGRTAPASAIYRLGLSLMAEARAAPVRRISEAINYRDGLLLALVSAVPDRARAVAAHALSSTLTLDDDARITITLPAEILKRGERRKRRRGAGRRVSFRNGRLHAALMEWRRDWRPMFGPGETLSPSLRGGGPDAALTPLELGAIVGRLTETHLGRRVTIHDVRGCVATEILEQGVGDGPETAAAVLGHRDPRVTEAWYIESDGLEAMAEWDAELEAMNNGEDVALDLPLSLD